MRVGEIELFAGPREDVTESVGLQFTRNGGAQESAMPGDVNRFILFHGEAVPRNGRTCPAVRSVFSCAASSTSASTIMRTSSVNFTVGFHPSFVRALLASPRRLSTSVGRV